ncbi:hypothetical protein P389DRAFT_175131 [Cystobasidium minutum MCA 4210]|uniref:uncharacterized protein n=1 Tax=Cystobasidium minutum MCA 4210 TaxID=1397322 RepID=UPI0034CDBFB3|eukprot:jgi/Rhomi1/175131/fgenesh1_kg.9_\
MAFGSSASANNVSASEAGPSSTDGAEGVRNKLQDSTTESLSTESARSSSSTSAKDTMSTINSTGTAPRLLRKTASKHTLRKAASPILSNNNVIHVLRDEDAVADSPTALNNQKGRPSSGSAAARCFDDMDTTTPVKSRTSAAAHVLRGPAPLSFHSPTMTADASTAGGPQKDGRKVTGGSNASNGSGTPRQVAHRNPRDSPVGETRVLKKSPASPLNVKRFPSGPPLALSSSSAHNGRKTPLQQRQQQKLARSQLQDPPLKKSSTTESKRDNGVHKPGIMDSENDIGGLWSPPKPTRTFPKRAPLGEIRHTQSQTNQANAAAPADKSGNSAGKKTGETKPRLKAKESLERILAYKQMQEENKAAGSDKINENIPPVPALPSSATTTTGNHAVSAAVTKENQTKDMPLTQAAMMADTAPSRVPQDHSGDMKARTNVAPQTLKSKTSFAGTLRGILGSAVAGWTDSLPTISHDRFASPVSMTSSSSSSKRVTILPANYSNSGHARPARNKSIRRAKSMYVNEMEAARMKRLEEDEAIGMRNNGRARRNSLILPTIIISDYTHQ